VIVSSRHSSLLLRDRFHQPEQTKSFWNVKRILHRRLPCDRLLMRGWPLTTKQVDAHRIAGDRRMRVDRGQGNAHGAVPGVRGFINARLHFEARVPGPAIFMVGLVEVDVEVNPFALRRNLKLLVALDVRKIGADEDFRYVPIP
jgi:hypothetical protein